MLLALALISFGCPLVAQQQPAVFDYDASRIEIASVTGLWRFHTGDDPKWADPSFNDSSWQLLRSDETWNEQGYSQYAGFSWYRFSVRLPAGNQDWSILLPTIRNSYELFANGRLVGRCGRLPPDTRIADCEDRLFQLPVERPNADVLIAIRIWLGIKGGSGGPSGETWVGKHKTVQRFAEADNIAARWSSVDRIFLVLFFVLSGTGSLFLFLLRRSEREYLWFALYSFGNAATYGGSMILIGLFPDMSVVAVDVTQGISFTVKDLAMILFAGTLLKAGRDKLLTVLTILAFAIFAVWELGVGYYATQQRPISATGFSMFEGTIACLDFALYVGIIYTIVLAIRRRADDARLLLFPLCISYAAVIFGIIRELTYVSGWHWLLERTGWFDSLTSAPFTISVKEVTEFLTQGALLGMLVLRFARSRRDEERLENELTAARAVQQVLIPAKTVQPPGFSVQSAYHPASQVGGDFFQILAAGSGGVIVVVGDVSGKGMPAAMTVSLLVGTLRTLAEITESPAAILNGLNRRAVTNSSGGFTTCLCCRIASNGTAFFSNAGHLSPYLNGQELQIATGLPLGLDPEAEYEETVLHLPEQARLAFLSDGVVEAKSSSGELFGFKRACEISLRSAEEIAQAAKDFGQEDDITVLTLALVAKPELLTA